MLHILERFLLHVVSSTFATLAAFFALRFALRKSLWLAAWLSPHKQHLLVVAALCIFSLMPLREPFDVWAGNNTFTKSIFDQLSWFVGPVLTIWGLSRFDKMEN